jgi:hypothetical protein
MILRYVLAWIPMVFIGITNGVLREFTYGKYFSELRAHQISTAIGILFFSLYIGLLTYFWGFESPQHALTIGLIWFGLTVTFEFIFGHYVAEQPWSRLLGDYNIVAGRLWSLVLIWLIIAPLLFYHVL